MFQIDYERAKTQQNALKRLENKPQIAKSNEFLQFGYTLKVIRKIHSITLQKLADNANTFRSRLSEYETGKRVPNLQTVEALYGALKRLGVAEEGIARLESAYQTTIKHCDDRRVAAVYKVLTKAI